MKSIKKHQDFFDLPTKKIFILINGNFLKDVMVKGLYEFSLKVSHVNINNSEHLKQIDKDFIYFETMQQAHNFANVMAFKNVSYEEIIFEENKQ